MQSDCSESKLAQLPNRSYVETEFLNFLRCSSRTADTFVEDVVTGMSIFILFAKIKEIELHVSSKLALSKGVTLKYQRKLCILSGHWIISQSTLFEAQQKSSNI